MSWGQGHLWRDGLRTEMVGLPATNVPSPPAATTPPAPFFPKWCVPGHHKFVGLWYLCIFMHLRILYIYIHIYIHNRETSFITINGIRCFYTHYLNKNFRHLRMESLVSYYGILLPSCGHICVLQQNLISPPPLTNPQYRHLTGSQKEENFFLRLKTDAGQRPWSQISAFPTH